MFNLAAYQQEHAHINTFYIVWHEIWKYRKLCGIITHICWSEKELTNTLYKIKSKDIQVYEVNR